MITTQTFEIKIALLGYVSVGKTTVLNALCREKYSEVSMSRTTAGVNHFRLSSSKKKTNAKAVEGGAPAKGTTTTTSSLGVEEEKNVGVVEQEEPLLPEHMSWGLAAAADRAPKSPAVTLREITSDNAKFRESNEIHERLFDVELEQFFLHGMRSDTSLVLVDIPGLNEAGTDFKYKNYVAAKWETFDFCVIVMDGHQGVNTEEQVSLLEFAKELRDTKKDMPIIILCNKVDDPDDEAQRALVHEARLEVERVFGVDNRDDALAALLEQAAGGDTNDAALHENLYPVFIPTSAIHAFIYQTASLMNMEQFKTFDKDLIEKLGRDEVGKWKWKKLSEDERYEVAHQAVSDETLYQERLEATNFDKFLTALNYAVGDERNQLQLIEKQLQVSLKYLSPVKGVAKQLASMYARANLLGVSTDLLRAAFWEVYEKLEQAAFEAYNLPTDVHHLTVPMVELQNYYKLANEVGWKDEEMKAISCMKALVRRQLAVIFNWEHLYRNKQWRPESAQTPITWKTLSPEDWKTICRSILLVSCYKSFCSEFGQEKVWIESLVDKVVRTAHCYLCGRPFDPTSQRAPKPTTFYFGGVATSASSSTTASSSGSGFVFPASSEKTQKSGFVPPSSSTATASLARRIVVPNSANSTASTSSSTTKTQKRAAGGFTFGSPPSSPKQPSFSFGPASSAREPESNTDASTGRLAACSCGNSDQVFGRFVMKDGALVVKEDHIAEKFDKIFQITVPDSFADPSHYGHLAYLYCEFVESTVGQSRNSSSKSGS